jgi:AAA-like domain
MSDDRYFHDAGGALSADHHTYIERKADRELLDALRAGEFCYVLNARQMGKSSLRNRVIKQLAAEDTICTSIDIGTLNTDDRMQWYSSFLSVLIEEFKLLDPEQEEAWFEENSNRTSNLMLLRFFENILLKNSNHSKIVIFLDEIDVLISRSFKDDFLRFIRSCYDKRANNPAFNRITFCLLGVVAPFDLISDTQQTFAFNIGKNIEMTGLEYDRSEELLLRGLVNKIERSRQAIEQIFKWTNGQPFLTQKLCQLAVDNATNNSIDIDRLVTSIAIENWGSKSGLIKDHLQNISNRLLFRDKDSDPMSLLILLGQIIDGKVVAYNPHDPQHVRLKLSGLIKIDRQNIEFFNQLYLQVFNKYWIQQQLADLPKTWFPQGNLQEMTYNAPPSRFVQGISKLLDTGERIALSAACLIFIDLLSLYSSYYLAGSTAWTNHFNRDGKGLFIEFFRCIFLVSFVGFSFNDLFKLETKQILTYDRHWWLRTCLGVLGFLFTIFVSIYMLYLGPKYLASQQSLPNNISWFQNYYLPYLLFLPYALSNFAIITVCFIPITIYSSIMSISNNIKSIKIFDRSMEKTNAYIKLYTSVSETDKEDIEREMIDAFDGLSANFLKDFTRYSLLFIGIIFLFIFELTLGKSTLAEATLALALIDYSFCWISIIIVFFFGALEYQKIFKNSCKLLFEIDSNTNEFRNKHNLNRLIRRGILNIRSKKYIYLMMSTMIIASIVIYRI